MRGNSGSRGGGSKEWRQELGWSTDLKKLRESCSLRSAKVGIFATYSAEVYGISFVSEKMIRIVPRHRRSKFGRRSFSVAAPMVWNSFPDSLRDPTLNIDNFRSTLRTHLFVAQRDT